MNLKVIPDEVPLTKFKYHSRILTEELEKWFGDNSKNVLQDAYLYDDKNWSIKDDDSDKLCGSLSKFV